MADFSNLIATINTNIRTNGQELITGAVLNSVLLDMVATLGNIEFLTEAQYDALDTPNPSTIYYIYES